ncbi:MAG: BREX-1 system phosphatase PglZ type A, partial [Pseudomonadota bacterium]
QIEKALARLFDDEGHRIVFWNDPEKEFLITVPLLKLPNGVTVLRLNQIGAFKAKIRIERDDPKGRYLLYAPTEEPDYEEDWLLDIRLYSRTFRADRASIILDQLGLANQHLREHLAARRKFFDGKQRLEKLQPLIAPDDTDFDLDRKMIAVVTKADQPEWFTIIRTLFHEFTNTNGEEIDLDKPPDAWLQIEKFDLDEPFWRMARSIFGYSEENPSLRNLLIRLLVTDFGHHLKKGVPDSLAHLLLPQSGKSNAVVCLAQWRDSNSKGSSYDRLSDLVAGILKIEDQLYGFDLEDLLEGMTFQAVEKAVALSLRDRVTSLAGTINVDDIRGVAAHRQAGHWASPNVVGSAHVPRTELHAVYEALVTASEFFALKNAHDQGFDYKDPETMYHAYEKELFRFDQLYRLFCEHADVAEAKIWDVLKKLRAEVEACYVNWYVHNLADHWGKFVDPKGSSSLLSSWKLGQVLRQERFFVTHVAHRLREAERRRSFVIISDALRYEAAEELTRELNGKYRFEAELSSQLGVLPSYTALGMASLLPHKKVEYKANGDVLVDGQPTASFDQRSQILTSVEGVAIKAEDLVEMKKDQGRDFVKDKRLVYIYHNAIDATGDQAHTETRTFEAVRRAIREVASVVAYVINNLNGHHVVITADHGFFFTESAPGEPDKSTLPDKPPGTVKTKKRYLIGHNLGDHESVWHGSTGVTAGAEGDMEFWIPKGANRFHFTGGARYVHGGAMLQEIVVPVVTVRHIKGKSVASTKTKRVTVHVLGTSHKITTSRHRFEMIQMEPVSDRVKPITLKVAVYEANEPVTNIESVTFESSSENIEERKKSITLILQDREYNKKAKYRLVLRDAETGVEQESMDVIIDRAFSDDF